ncbi:MAG: hypothetical protein RRZ92_03110 [Bacilli bacterium]
MNNIKTDVVKNVIVNGVYQVSNADLHIDTEHGDKHDVIVCSVNKKKKTASVKTITSLERRNNPNTNHREYRFINSKLEAVRNGDILPIPKNKLRSRHFSGICHNRKIVSFDKIHYKEPNDRTIFPKRYEKLIKRK